MKVTVIYTTKCKNLKHNLLQRIKLLYLQETLLKEDELQLNVNDDESLQINKQCLLLKLLKSPNLILLSSLNLLKSNESVDSNDENVQCHPFHILLQNMNPMKSLSRKQLNENPNDLDHHQIN